MFSYDIACSVWLNRVATLKHFPSRRHRQQHRGTQLADGLSDARVAQEPQLII